MREGWEQRTLGELCQIIAGQSPESDFYNSDGRGIPFYQGKKEFTDRYIGPPSTWTTKTTKLAQNGDILMSVRAPVGPVNFATQDVCIGRGLAAIRTSEKLNRYFLFYQLRHLEPDISGRDGAVFPSINKKEIESLQIVVPPLPEQERIVRLLDEAFAGIEIAKANVEKNIQNARAVFESYLGSVLTQELNVSQKSKQAVGMKEGWVTRKLSEVAAINYGYTESASSEPVGPRFLRITDIQEDNVDWSTVPYCKIDLTDLPKYRLASGDIVFARTGATTGKSFLVNQPPEAVFASYLIRLRLTGDELLPEFVSFFFKTSGYWKSIRDGSIGSAQGGFNATKLGAMTIPVPPLPEQERIVRLLDELKSELGFLDQTYQAIKKSYDSLKWSLLHQAFNGDL